MDDLEIAWRPLGELIPYARNPRTHSDAQVAQIAASINEFGWTVPILTDSQNGILADLRELGFELGLVGFADGELERLLAGQTAGLTEDDDAPALPEQAVTQAG